LEIVTLRKEDKPVLHAITVSTDGFIHIYALDDLTTLKTIAPLARWDTKGSRLTCLTVAGYNDADATTTQVQQAEASDSDSDDSDFGLDGAAESSEEDGSEVNEAELAALEELAALQEEAARDSESDEEEEEAEEWGGIGA
jgi:protein MAK11